jgi:hypothetical protein
MRKQSIKGEMPGVPQGHSAHRWGMRRRDPGARTKGGQYGCLPHSNATCKTRPGIEEGDMGRGVPQWLSAYLACTRPWVQFPVLNNTNKK